MYCFRTEHKRIQYKSTPTTLLVSCQNTFLAFPCSFFSPNVDIPSDNISQCDYPLCSSGTGTIFRRKVVLKVLLFSHVLFYDSETEANLQVHSCKTNTHTANGNEAVSVEAVNSRALLSLGMLRDHILILWLPLQYLSIHG